MTKCFSALQVMPWPTCFTYCQIPIPWPPGRRLWDLVTHKWVYRVRQTTSHEQVFCLFFWIWKIVTLMVYSLILLNYCLSVCYNRLKNSLQTARLDLYVNGEILCPSDDKRLISQVPLRDRTVSVRLVFHLHVWMNLHLTVVLLLFWFFLIDPYLTSLETNYFSCGKWHKVVHCTRGLTWPFWIAFIFSHMKDFCLNLAYLQNMMIGKCAFIWNTSRKSLVLNDDTCGKISRHCNKSVMRYLIPKTVENSPNFSSCTPMLFSWIELKIKFLLTVNNSQDWNNE